MLLFATMPQSNVIAQAHQAARATEISFNLTPAPSEPVQAEVKVEALATPAPTPEPVQAAPQAVSYAPVAAGDAKVFIYGKESGNNPGAINASSGACGLGQALPCSKMPCSLSDYACQDGFFTSYMLSRYGTWEVARAFWLVHSWW